MAYLFTRLPTGFLPDKDRALLFGQVTTTPDCTAEQTAAVNKRVVDYLLAEEKDNVVSAFSVIGFNFAGQAQNAGFLAISLKDWSERPLPSQPGSAIAGRLMGHFAGDRAAMIFAVQPAAVMDLGNASRSAAPSSSRMPSTPPVPPSPPADAVPRWG